MIYLLTTMLSFNILLLVNNYGKNWFASILNGFACGMLICAIIHKFYHE